MKRKLVAAFIIIFSLNFQLLSQNNNKSNKQVSYCKIKKDTITFSEFKSCSKLILSNPKMKIKSFTITGLVEDDNGNYLMLSEQMKGSLITKVFMESLESVQDKLYKISFENIIALEGKKEVVISNLNFIFK